MATALQTLIDAYIKRNANQEITGPVLNGVLTAISNALGTPFIGSDGYWYTYDAESGQFVKTDTPAQGETGPVGVTEAAATIDDQIGTPSVSVSLDGTRLDFAFRNLKGQKGDTGDAGITAAVVTVDAGIGTPSVDASITGTTLTLAFHNLKGETGAAAGFGTIEATVDDTTGTPAVVVTESGPDTAKNLSFAFSGLKGPKGDQGDTGVSADYPITIANNLTTDDPTAALAASQGVVLKGEIDQLGQEKVSKQPGYNLFNPATVTEHAAITNSGEVLVDPNFASVVSDFIPVKPSTVYQSMYDGWIPIDKVAFYDSDKAFISISNYVQQVTTPANCAYVRLRVLNSALYHTGLQEGTNQIEYAPFDELGGYVGERFSDLQAGKVTVSPGKNILPDNTLIYDNTILYNDGTLGSQSGYKSTGYVSVNPSTSYSNSIEGGAFRKVAFYTQDFTLIPDTLVQNVATFTTPSNCKFVRISVPDASASQLLLAKSPAPIPYESYNPIEGYIENSKSLLNKVDVNSRNLISGEFQQNTLLLNDGGVVTGDTYAGYQTTQYVAVKDSTQYCGSIEAGSTGFRKVCFYDENKTCIGYVEYTNTITTPSSCAFVRISFTNDNALLALLAESAEPIKYEPFNEISGYLPDEDASPDDHTIAAIKKIKMAEWSELQFGLFIHWGVYSAWAGAYSGDNIDGEHVETTGGTEWMWWSLKIPKATYKAKAVDFASTGWDPDEICRLAQAAGMKYIILTLRHHEGFSLFPTNHCEWDVTSSSAADDIVKKLKDACDRHHLKFCTYVSALLDWNDEGGFGQEQWNNGVDPYTLDQHITFTEEQAAYVKEIVDKFDPWIVWYDGGTYITQPSAVRDVFYTAQQKYFPYPIFNSRGSGGGNYIEAEDVYADHPGTTQKIERATAITGWGYNAARDGSAGSYPALQSKLWDIFEAVSRGFNYLLNISPKGDGSIPSLQVQWMDGLAAFFRKYTFINGARRLFNFAQPSWGRPLYIGNSVYLFIVPGQASIEVDSILAYNLKSVHIYGVQDSEDNWSIVGPDKIRINNLPSSSDDWYIVARMDFYNDVTCQDYNIVDSSISARSLVRSAYQTWASQTTGLLFDGTYIIGSDINTTVSRFKFSGSSGSKAITLNGTISGSVNLAVKVYDKDGNAVFSGTASNGSVTGVPLTSGEIYLLEVAKTGSGTMAVTSVSIA